MKLRIIFEDGNEVAVVGHTEAKCLDLADTVVRQRIGEDVPLPNVESIINLEKNLYDQITQAYFEDDETEFDGVDINDHVLLKLVAFMLDDAIAISNAEDTAIETLMYNFLDYEINTLKKMQEVFA